MPNLLSAHFPDYDWLPWKFPAVPNKYWQDSKNQRNFLLWAEKQLKIKEMNDWYKITYEVTNYHKFILFILRI